MKNISRSVCAAAVAAVAALGIGLGSGTAVAAPVPTPANPANVQDLMDEIAKVAPQVGITAPLKGSGAKKLVTFGDSFTAIAGKNGSRGEEPGKLPWTVNCSNDLENWPKVAARQAGVSLGDWSCNGMGGAPLVQLAFYLESAIFYGDIGPGTKDVALMYGGMDTFQWIDTAGFLVGNAPTTQVYDALIGYVKDRVHEVAPDAKITLLSYPEFANGDDLCMVNTKNPLNNETVTTPITVPGAQKVQEALRDNIRHAADVNGLNFVDIYQQTRGHGTCAPKDSDRYVAGFVDPAMGTMTNHPTFAGEKAMGRIVADQVLAK